MNITATLWIMLALWVQGDVPTSMPIGEPFYASQQACNDARPKPRIVMKGDVYVEPDVICVPKTVRIIQVRPNQTITVTEFK